MGPLNAFTVDVEDYFQVSAFEGQIDRRDWGHFSSRVVANTERVLRLLDRHEVRATFYVLGWVAEHHPAIVRTIHQAGHEIGSHSFWHRLIYHLDPDAFREDLIQSRSVLEDLIAEPVTAYRAPSFSITRQSLWALDILAQEGFRVDSSIYPIYHDRYGIPQAEPRLHRLPTSAGELWEFPPAVARFGWINLPVSGGGYFRLYPLGMTTRLLRAINSAQQRPFVFYIHPWELDPEQPRLRAGSFLARKRHYVNLATTERKLDHLLRQFRFATVSDVVSTAASATGKPLSGCSAS